MSDTILSVFDRIYVINLAHRADRRREMEAELNRIGLGFDHPAVTLFPASFPEYQGPFSSRGARACFESQLGVHRAILSGGVNRALMLEDDASFPPDFNERFAAVSGDLRRLDWDLFYSVLPLEKEAGDEEVSRDLLRLSSEHVFPLAHFVGFSAGFSRRAVPYLETMMRRPAGDPQGGPMHVDGAYCWMRKDFPDLLVLGSKLPLATQRSSRSDIADLPFWDRLPVLRQVAASARGFAPVRSLVHSLRGRLRP